MERFGFAIVAACVLACSPAVADDPLIETDAQTSSGSEASSDSEFSASISASAPVTTTAPDESSGGSSTGGVDCSVIEAESRHCLTMVGSNIHLIGLDTGLTCELPGLQHEFPSSSLVRDETSVMGCHEEEHILLRGDFASGDVAIVEAPCQALAEHPDGLLVLPSTSGSPELYATFDDVASGMPIQTFMLEPSAARMALDGDRLYTAWHESAAVQVWELSTSTYLMDVILQDYDGAIHGMAVIDGRLLVLGPPDDRVLRAYDAVSGTLHDEIDLFELSAPRGLACR